MATVVDGAITNCPMEVAIEAFDWSPLTGWTAKPESRSAHSRHDMSADQKKIRAKRRLSYVEPRGATSWGAWSCGVAANHINVEFERAAA